MPVYPSSGVHPETVRNLISFDLDSQAKQNDLTLYFPQTSLITLSRNNIVREALKQGADWILMWDSDIQIKDDGFFAKMVKTAYDYNVPVVGLPCRLKVPEVIYNFAVKRGKEYINYSSGGLELPQEAIEVDAIGTGVMLINAKWLKEKCPTAPWFCVVDTLTGAFPEDWYFCEKVKEKGGKVIMLPIKTTHWGESGYAIR